MPTGPWVKASATPVGGTPNPLPAVSGVNLTALNGTQVTSGTIADARLSVNVLLASSGFTTGKVFQFGGSMDTHTVAVTGGQVISWVVVGP